MDPYNFCKMNNFLNPNERVYANGRVQIVTGGFQSPVMSVYDKKHPLNPFFADMPQQYDAFMNLQNLGPYSTFYELSDFTETLSNTCEEALSPPRNQPRNLYIERQQPYPTPQMYSGTQQELYGRSGMQQEPTEERPDSKPREGSGVQQEYIDQERKFQQPNDIQQLYPGVQDDLKKSTSGRLRQDSRFQSEEPKQSTKIQQPYPMYQAHTATQQEPPTQRTEVQQEYEKNTRSQEWSTQQEINGEGSGTPQPYNTRQSNMGSQQEHVRQDSRTPQPQVRWKEAQLSPALQDRQIVTSGILQWMYEAEQLLEDLNPSSTYQTTLQPSETTILQLEMMVCVFHDKCRGGATEYDEDFLHSFNPTRKQSRCYVLIERITADQTQLRLEKWMVIITKYFRCDNLK